VNYKGKTFMKMLGFGRKTSFMQQKIKMYKVMIFHVEINDKVCRRYASENYRIVMWGQ
jgi:hypothetical protein